MAKKTAANGMSFAEACEYLGLPPDQLVMLRDQGLIACLSEDSKQVYPRTGLDITQRLLKLGQERGWEYDTLAWYADLVFAAEIGRAILLPINSSGTSAEPQLTSWLETPYAVTVLEDLTEDERGADSAIVMPLRSLAALAIGQEQYWSNLSDLQKSAIFPIISRFEEAETPIIGQGTMIARDIGINFVMMMYAYTVIASPISKEFRALVQTAQGKIKAAATPHITVSLNEQEAIRQQPLVPVDKIYASKATEIHSAPAAEDWNFKLGILRADRRTIALQMKLPLDSDQPLIDNVIDMIRPFLGVFGARVVQLLYEIANDPPYFRHPVISFDTNTMLDRLGLKRDNRGIHRSKNRERLRDALNAAHNLEMVGEYTAWEDGRTVRKQFYRTVLSILGATFDAEETASISTLELRTRGLAKSMQVRLNFYDGIRRPDGKLGNQYVLIQRLVEPDKLPKANYSATHELLRAYLIFRYRQTQMKTRVLQVTRQTVLEKANIKNRNASRATMTLRKALDRLVADGTLESYSAALPTKPQSSFEVVLAEAAVQDLETAT